MNWFGYKNISKIIMTTTILIILSNTLLISLFYYKNQINEYDEALINLKHEHINKQKINLKKDIHHLINMIEYKYSPKQLKTKEVRDEIKQWISSLSFDNEKSDYIFVYELLNRQGGDDFARMVIHPTRPKLVGTLLSTKYKDINGFSFRKKFMQDINIKGDSIVSYAYQKATKRIEEKISYFKYYKPLNWIIAKGVYNDEIKQEMTSKREDLKHRVTKQIKQNIFFFILFSIVATIIAYFIGKMIQFIINEKNKMVKKTTKELALLNRELDSRVKKELEKNKEQEQILMQKSKFIALGETISLIAHQWRQPISELGAIILNIKLHHKLDKLDSKLMNKKATEVETILEYMSKTIDDFRTFFKPNKNKYNFNINSSTQRVLQITKPMLGEHQIKIIQDIDNSIEINSYQNEFEQVLLNIISNAKDAIVSDNIQNGNISINVYQTDKIYIKICDNAKGIDGSLIHKIFNPYFTTKSEAEGTGIGLYMSKMIIEENMAGKLSVQSSNEGTCFIISF